MYMHIQKSVSSERLWNMGWWSSLGHWQESQVWGPLNRVVFIGDLEYQTLQPVLGEQSYSTVVCLWEKELTGCRKRLWCSAHCPHPEQV